VLKSMDPSSRLQRGAVLATDLAAFSRDGDGLARAAKQGRDATRQLVFRTKIRMAALARVEKALDAIAGWLYLADLDGDPGRVPKPSREASLPAKPAGSARDLPSERAVAQRLVDCEALDLKLPKVEWVDPGPALPAWDDELAQAKKLLASVSASGLPNQSGLRPGQATAELEVTPYRGELPAVGAGKPLLLFFWATWCKACKAALPELLATARNRNLTILAITDDSEANLERFLAVPREFPALIARDPGRQLGARFGVRSLPSFVLLDGQGRVANTATNYLRDLPADGTE
jgi:thiol-disulfide isomerase/thioredoxin